MKTDLFQSWCWKALFLACWLWDLNPLTQPAGISIRTYSGQEASQLGTQLQPPQNSCCRTPWATSHPRSRHHTPEGPEPRPIHQSVDTSSWIFGPTARDLRTTFSLLVGWRWPQYKLHPSWGEHKPRTTWAPASPTSRSTATPEPPWPGQPETLGLSSAHQWADNSSRTCLHPPLGPWTDEWIKGIWYTYMWYIYILFALKKRSNCK